MEALNFPGSLRAGEKRFLRWCSILLRVLILYTVADKGCGRNIPRHELWTCVWGPHRGSLYQEGVLLEPHSKGWVNRRCGISGDSDRDAVCGLHFISKPRPKSYSAGVRSRERASSYGKFVGNLSNFIPSSLITVCQNSSIIWIYSSKPRGNLFLPRSGKCLCNCGLWKHRVHLTRR
jgi:hypothetical protein